MKKTYVASVVLKGGNLAWRDLSLARPKEAAAGAFLKGRDLFVRTYVTEMSGHQPIVDEDERRYCLDVSELRSDDPFPAVPVGSAVTYVGAALGTLVSVVWRPAVVVNSPYFLGVGMTVVSVVDSWVKPEWVPLQELERDVRVVVEDLATSGERATKPQAKQLLRIFAVS